MSGELPLTPEDVAEIVAILDGSGYETLELRTPRFGLRVSRSGAGWTQEWDYGPASPQPSVSSEVEPGGAGVSTALDTNGVGDDEGAGAAVRAPLPGTFYRAPQPGAPPFVELGDVVGPDTVVGIVETMKLMNPVHAGAAGRIVALVVDNGTMVDADAVLMRIASERA